MSQCSPIGYHMASIINLSIMKKIEPTVWQRNTRKITYFANSKSKSENYLK